MHCETSRQTRREADEYDKRQAETERENILKARAKTLAGVMVDNQDACEITGVTMESVTGSMDDYEAFSEAAFAAANGSPATLKAMLEATAEELIRAELEKMDHIASESASAERALERRAARFWGERA